MQSPPTPVARPKLASWLFERSIGNAAAADALGTSEQSITNWCKPFGDPGRTVPREAALERIVAWTEGAVTAVDFYPPHLRGPQRYEPAPARGDAQ
ncbi:MAG: hypothetical protein J0M21_00520 [Xanthomonadales bacterium]|nr:hypothetical protein [Xanthomonadales bacterium]